MRRWNPFEKLVAVAALTLVPALPLTAISEEAGAVRNWSAPPYWTEPASVPAEAEGREALAAGRQPLNAGPQVLPFVTLTPCRIADTRAGSGFPAGYGPPSILGGGTQRTFVIAGQCGVPSGAKAVSLNFAVWAPTTQGDLRAFPGPAGTPPTVSTLNWEANILALANAAVVSLGASGDLTVQIDGAGTVDIFIDVNGYYTPLGIVNAVNGLTGNVTISSLPPSGSAGGALAGTYPSPSIAAGAVSAGAIASGQVVKGLNGLTDAVTLSGAGGITITPSGNTLTIAGPTSIQGYEMNQTQFNDNFSYGSFAQHIFACSAGKKILGAGAYTNSTAYIIQSIQYFHDGNSNQDKVFVTTMSLCNPSLYAGCPGNPITTSLWLTCAN